MTYKMLTIEGPLIVSFLIDAITVVLISILFAIFKFNKNLSKKKYGPMIINIWLIVSVIV